MKKAISTDKAPAAIGPYSQAIEVNGMVYTSGVIPVVPSTGEIPEGAAAQADHLRRVGLLRVGQRTQIAVHPLLRVVADGAGVQHHHVRLGRIVGERAPHSPEHTHDILAVGHVLLAAEGVHQRAEGPVGVHLLQLCFKIPLAVQLRGGDLYLCSFQEDLPAPGGGEVEISWTV